MGPASGLLQSLLPPEKHGLGEKTNGSQGAHFGRTLETTAIPFQKQLCWLERARTLQDELSCRSYHLPATGRADFNEETRGQRHNFIPPTATSMHVVVAIHGETTPSLDNGDECCVAGEARDDWKRKRSRCMGWTVPANAQATPTDQGLSGLHGGVLTQQQCLNAAGLEPLNNLMHCPAVFAHFSPAPVKTDRAVRIP